MFLFRNRGRILTLTCLVLICSCDRVKGVLGAEADAGLPIPKQLYGLHQALEEGASSELPHAVAVLAVVADQRIGQAVGTAAPDKKDAPQADTLRRERLVRDALNNGFVRNKLLSVVAPEQSHIDTVTAEIQRINSAAISVAMAKTIGEALQVDCIVNAVVSEEGKSVNVAAHRTADGTLIFQDTVHNWDIFAGPAEAEAR